MSFRARRGEALALGEWPVGAAVDSGLSGTPPVLTGRTTPPGAANDGRSVIGRAAAFIWSRPTSSTRPRGGVSHALAQVVHLSPGCFARCSAEGARYVGHSAAAPEPLPGLLPGDPPPVEVAVAGAQAGLIGAGLLGAAG